MDLTIKDVAELLNVTEPTILRWISENQIPNYRINQNYFFSRSEIETWVITHHSVNDVSLYQCNKNLNIPDTEHELPASIGGHKQFSLFRAIHKGAVFHHHTISTKAEIIRETMRKSTRYLNVDGDVMADLLLDREQMMSTGLNNGIAVPHPRDFLLESPHDVIIVLFLEEPIDYDALDGKPVHTLFFLFACEDKRHLHLLAKIAHLSQQEQTLEFFKTRPSKDKVLSYVKEWESSIPTKN